MKNKSIGRKLPLETFECTEWALPIRRQPADPPPSLVAVEDPMTPAALLPVVHFTLAAPQGGGL
jgi:hypothetical protein